MAVRLWPTLPKDHEQNGLTALERPLLDDPEGPYYFIAEVNRRRSTYDDDAAENIPTIRVLHGGALLGELSGEARDLLNRAQAKRTGKRGGTPPMIDGNGQVPGEGGEDNAGTPGDETPGGAGLDLGDDPDGDNEPGEPDAPGEDDDADGGTAPSPRFLAAVSDE